MKRAIVGYHRDAANDWVAELDCLHDQHVRHNPPFSHRPWVETAAGRESNLGALLNCVLCDRLEMPQGLVPYNRTPEFTETSIPKGLRAHHATKRGVWGRIRVTAGTLRYTVEEPEKRVYELSATHHANIAPQALHAVEPIGEVRFYVEFLSHPKD